MADTPPIFPTGRPEDAAGLREILRQAADAVADYLAGLDSRAIFPSEAAAPESALLPERGEPLDRVLENCTAWAIQHSIHVGHPGYLGHMDSGVAVAGILGDFVASALNQNLLAHELAPGATMLEQALVAHFATLAGLPEGAGGTFTPGGTTANLTGLLLARDAAHRDSSRLGVSGEAPAAILASADAHYSIAKAAAVLGLGSERVLRVPVAGPSRRMDAAALPIVHRAALATGLRPVAVVATAGTTSCGALDPLAETADFCAEQGLWLHVDAALGGALLLHPRERGRLAGIHRADSIALDPHKWLYVPKSCGLLLVRRSRDLKPAEYEAPYLDRLAGGSAAGPASQGRRSLDGSRRFDALKLWMVLRHLGRSGLAELLDSRLELTAWLHQALSEHAFFLPRHRPDTNVLAFAPREAAHGGDVLAAQRSVERQGRLWSSYTRLEGRVCHRVVLLNPSGTREHLESLLAALEAAHRFPDTAATEGFKGHGRPPAALLKSTPPSRQGRADKGFPAF